MRNKVKKNPGGWVWSIKFFLIIERRMSVTERKNFSFFSSLLVLTSPPHPPLSSWPAWKVRQIFIWIEKKTKKNYFISTSHQLLMESKISHWIVRRSLKQSWISFELESRVCAKMRKFEKSSQCRVDNVTVPRNCASTLESLACSLSLCQSLRSREKLSARKSTRTTTTLLATTTEIVPKMSYKLLSLFFVVYFLCTCCKNRGESSANCEAACKRQHTFFHFFWWPKPTSWY